jgi:hypothetical protein
VYKGSGQATRGGAAWRQRRRRLTRQAELGTEQEAAGGADARCVATRGTSGHGAKGERRPAPAAGTQRAGQWCWAHGLTANGLVDWATCVMIFATRLQRRRLRRVSANSGHVSDGFYRRATCFGASEERRRAFVASWMLRGADNGGNAVSAATGATRQGRQQVVHREPW